MTDKTLAQCLQDVALTQDEALTVAAKLYPKGQRVGVMLSSRQRNPSPATICGCSVHTWEFGDGTRASIQVRVEMDNYMSHRSRFASVSPDAIRAA